MCAANANRYVSHAKDDNLVVKEMISPSAKLVDASIVGFINQHVLSRLNLLTV
jgi:hypothetical protein